MYASLQCWRSTRCSDGLVRQHLGVLRRNLRDACPVPILSRHVTHARPVPHYRTDSLGQVARLPGPGIQRNGDDGGRRPPGLRRRAVERLLAEGPGSPWCQRVDDRRVRHGGGAPVGSVSVYGGSAERPAGARACHGAGHRARGGRLSRLHAGAGVVDVPAGAGADHSRSCCT